MSVWPSIKKPFLVGVILCALVLDGDVQSDAHYGGVAWFVYYLFWFLARRGSLFLPTILRALLLLGAKPRVNHLFPMFPKS